MMQPRENISKLKPYTSARDLVKEEGLIFLDANENPFDNEMNRYPDPHQHELKQALGKWLKAEPSQIFAGNGSDEVIDLAIRAYTRPGKDRIITLGPTYSMYKVQAEIQDVEVKEIDLDGGFQPDTEKVMEEVTERDKIIFLCSPNNPTGNLMERQRIISLAENFDGLVFIDEAYVDFAPEGSVIDLVDKYPNFMVSRTFSKAMGMAGIRLGLGISNPGIIQTLSKIKYPYNVNRLTQQAALEALSDLSDYREQIRIIVKERDKLGIRLERLSFVKHIFPSDANFVLMEVKDAASLVQFLKEKGIVIRDRSGLLTGKELVRITVGTPQQNKQLIEELKIFDNG
ncbi:MAG: histidinol-phosphate transaminase [Bacteroidales bacterium]|nr:histidinol-phosphate transaminase [Bacteroidales bacterium]MCF8333659.1 histidinol-phosphate transaminase [Bacteroidales bacterium]